MKKSIASRKLVALAVFAGLSILFSCQDNGSKINLTDETAVVAGESSTDAYYQDVDDMSGVAVAGTSETNSTTSGGKQYANGRRVTGIADYRFGDCAIITVTPDTTADHPKGVITIDFGSGCQDSQGDVRKGKIIISYDGRRFMPGSVIVVTLDNYSFNQIKLEGTRTLTNLSSSMQDNPKFEIQLADGKATDTVSGQFITREHCFDLVWTRANNPLQDELTVTGCGDQAPNATGIDRYGDNYAMTILEPLVYHRLCPIAVSGKKQIVVGDKTIVIDYGDGTCDRSVIITVNGTNTETVTLSGQ